MKITKEKHTKQIGTCKAAVEISWCNCSAPYLERVLPKEGGFLKQQPSFFLFFLWENNKFSQGICFLPIRRCQFGSRGIFLGCSLSPPLHLSRNEKQSSCQPPFFPPSFPSAFSQGTHTQNSNKCFIDAFFQGWFLTAH